MSRLAKLKAATRLRDVANLLQINPSHLSYILFKTPPAKRYETFEVPKRNGQKRIIDAPIGALKFAQRQLSTLLQDCVEEINSSTGRKDRVSHGFKRDKSILTNAREHRNRLYVFNIDLADFFPSINLGRRVPRSLPILQGAGMETARACLSLYGIHSFASHPFAPNAKEWGTPQLW